MKKKQILLNLIKVDKGEGGSAKLDKKFPNVNTINLAKVDKGGRGKTLIHPKWIICLFFGILP